MCFARQPAPVYLSQPGLGADPGARVSASFGDDPGPAATKRTQVRGKTIRHRPHHPINPRRGRRNTFSLARYRAQTTARGPMRSGAPSTRLLRSSIKPGPALLTCSTTRRLRSPRVISHHAALRQLAKTEWLGPHGCLKNPSLKTNPGVVSISRETLTALT